MAHIIFLLVHAAFTLVKGEEEGLGRMTQTPELEKLWAWLIRAILKQRLAFEGVQCWVGGVGTSIIASLSCLL